MAAVRSVDGEAGVTVSKEEAPLRAE